MVMESASLKQYNTFGLPVKAENVVVSETIDQMFSAYQCSQKDGIPFLILGEGSN